MKRRAKINLTGKYVILTIASLLVLLPVLWMISTSLKNTPEIMNGKITWIPKNITFDAYLRLFKDYPFADYYKSTLIISATTVIIAMAFAILSGYGITRFRFPGKEAYLTFVLVTQMFPSIMLLIPFYKLMKTFHLNDTYTGMILVYVSHTIPFCTWLMKGYMESIPTSLDESAMIDGYSRFKILIKIICPLAMPGIAATAIYSLIQTWNEFMFASILINKETLKTLPVGIGQLNGYYRIQYNDLMAACIISSLPIVTIYVFMQKYFIAGLTAGAVKE